MPALRQLWGTEQDPRVRLKLLEAFGLAGDVDILSKAARDPDPQLRRKAIEGLGINDEPAAGRALRDLYGRLPDRSDKEKILEAFMIRSDAKTLIELFRAEKDPALKKEILQQLSVMDDPEATEIILEVLGE
jgi:HEAT repeat protein